MSADPYENRLRRVAERQGLFLSKSRRRDRRAPDFGLYRLRDADPYALTLDEVAAALDEPASPMDAADEAELDELQTKGAIAFEVEKALGLAKLSAGSERKVIPAAVLAVATTGDAPALVDFTDELEYAIGYALEFLDLQIVPTAKPTEGER